RLPLAHALRRTDDGGSAQDDRPGTLASVRGGHTSRRTGALSRTKRPAGPQRLATTARVAARFDSLASIRWNRRIRVVGNATTLARPTAGWRCQLRASDRLRLWGCPGRES